jgi:hypothetical protein
MYCLTKAYWNKTNPLPVDNATLGMFAIGFALEDVLLKPYPIEGVSLVPPYMYEEVHFSPDYFATIIGGEMDLKTTRMWPDPDGRPKKVAARPDGFPDTWLRQFMGYAHRFGATPADEYTLFDYVDYSVAILYIMSGELVAGTIRFAWEEVELNMGHHLHRAAILEDHLAGEVVPTPFVYCELWECKNCIYFNRCKTTEAG